MLVARDFMYPQSRLRRADAHERLDFEPVAIHCQGVQVPRPECVVAVAQVRVPRAVHAVDKRKQTFLICRYVLIVSTGLLAYAEVSQSGSAVGVALLVVVALTSNVVLSQAPPFSFFDAWMQAPVLVADTAMISIALLLSRASQESFLFFFFVLIMAAKIENLVVLGIGAGLIGFASFLLGDPEGAWMSPILMRVPFMLATGIFFGYVVLPERTGQMVGFSGAAGVTSISRAKGAGPRRPVMQDAATGTAS